MRLHRTQAGKKTIIKSSQCDKTRGRVDGGGWGGGHKGAYQSLSHSTKLKSKRWMKREIKRWLINDLQLWQRTRTSGTASSLQMLQLVIIYPHLCFASTQAQEEESFRITYIKTRQSGEQQTKRETTRNARITIKTQRGWNTELEIGLKR